MFNKRKHYLSIEVFFVLNVWYNQNYGIEVKNLSFSYENDGGYSGMALQNVNFTADFGECVGIIGANGAGKSTFLRCVDRLEKPETGTITIDGETQDLAHIHGKDLTELRKKTGMVFQNFNLFPHYTVMKNVTDAPVSVQKRDKNEVEKEAKELLKKVGLDGKEDSYPCQLSGGQQQRVAIARALAMNPEMLFFDEPTSALDPEITAGILKVLRQLADEKMTMIIVTHEIEFARKVADRVIFMDGGVIVEQGKPEDVIDNPSNERTKAFLQKMEK